MRWVKHLSTAHDDAEMDRLLEECGAEGYGAYWLIIEDIAGPMDSGRMEPEATHSDLKWSQIVHVHHLTWKSLKKKLGSKLLVITESADGRVCIAAPNILKYKDEYSRKSGVTPEQSRGDQKGVDKKINTGKNAPPPLESNLEECAAAALSRMLEKHPYPSNPLDAAYQFERIVSGAVNPVAVIESSEKNHCAWCDHWFQKTNEEGRAPWMPKLAQFFQEGYHAKLPPVRDGPVKVKRSSKSKQEQDSDAAREQFERLSRGKVSNGPEISSNRG